MTIRHGTVVNTRTENGILYCDVRPPRAGVTHEDCAVIRPTTGTLTGIREGARVIITKTEDQLWLVLGTLGSEGESALASNITDNERVLYSDENTEIRLSKDSGTYKLDVSSGADINIHADGDVNLSAGGSFYIDGQDFWTHTHDYGDSTIADTGDGSGTESTETKTSQPPN